MYQPILAQQKTKTSSWEPLLLDFDSLLDTHNDYKFPIGNGIRIC